MTYASHVFNHSRKLRTAPNLLRHEQANLIRWFSRDACRSLDGADVDASKICRHGFVPRKGGGASNYSSGWSSSRGNFKQCQRTSYPDVVVAQYLGIFRRNLSNMTMNMGFPMNDVICSSMCSSSHLQSWRSFSSNSDLPPHQEIGMPSLSPTMTEGNIARWLKKEGEKLSPGEVLCEVETDKTTVEMESMEEGYLAKIIGGDGSQGIKVGEIIAITVEDEEDISKFRDYQPSQLGAPGPAPESKKPSEPAPTEKETAKAPASQPESKVSMPSQTPSAEDRIFASPLARKLAEDNNVPLSSIKGTGPDGRIVKADIEDFLASRVKEAPATAVKAAEATLLDYTDIPHSQIRKVTASRLLMSKQTIPHYYLTVDTRVDKLMELRNQLNALQEASGGKRLSINDLVIKAAALALRKVPQCNSSWTNDYIRQFHNVNINVAVQTDNGLYVPVVRDADKKGLSKISEEVKVLAQNAKENSLKPDDYEGGTFTVSNLGGPFGIKQFCAIINPPQAAILAVGTAEKRVVPGSGPDQFDFASFMSVTLSCDHRVIDGAIGAEWLKAFKGYIENPESMLL
ncbi:hypothetical protein Ancab_012560 [Ancistrocladus abbreviatus]